MHHIVTIHGLDTRSAFYSQKLQENLKPLLADDLEYKFTALYIGDRLEKRLDGIEAQQDIPAFKSLHALGARDFMKRFVGDMYQYRGEFLDPHVAGVPNLAPGDTYHLVTHSWGCCYFFDALRHGYYTDLMRKPDSLTTHGCPLDLYRLQSAYGAATKYSFPNWSNWYHLDDFIGGPMAHCSNAADHVIDDAGPGWINFIPEQLEDLLDVHQAHSAGWESKAMALDIANKVRGRAGLALVPKTVLA